MIIFQLEHYMRMLLTDIRIIIVAEFILRKILMRSCILCVKYIYGKFSL